MKKLPLNRLQPSFHCFFGLKTEIKLKCHPLNLHLHSGFTETCIAPPHIYVKKITRAINRSGYLETRQSRHSKNLFELSVMEIIAIPEARAGD